MSRVLRTTTDFSPFLNDWGSRMALPPKNRPGPAREILPGWSLGPNITIDGRGYELMPENFADRCCGLAVVTDRRAIIRQSKTIDCAIWRPGDACRWLSRRPRRRRH